MHSSDPSPFTRRAFVRALGLAGAAAATAPWLRAEARPPAAGGPRTLVLIHLAGGHDGWSAFVPADDDAYRRARPTLALARSDLVRAGEAVWVNRAAGDLAPLFAEGKLAVLTQVGFAPAILSHHRAAQLWRTATAPEEIADAPWVGRCGAGVCELPGDFSAAIERVGAEAAGGAGAGVFSLQLGGFDTHFDQRAAQDRALGIFARGVARLQRRLERRGVAGRVLIVAFSEFGRTACENEFAGTDHAAGGHCYFIGSRVRGGVHGESGFGLPAPTVDPRRIIATCARGWLGARPGAATDAALSPLPLLS